MTMLLSLLRCARQPRNRRGRWERRRMLPLIQPPSTQTYTLTDLARLADEHYRNEDQVAVIADYLLLLRHLEGMEERP